MAAAVLKEGKKTESVVIVKLAECDCCGLTEECTQAYIASVREKFEGRWLCGLCSEAVNDETVRSEEDITTNEAMDRHMKFCG
ncbi:hypothetical protein Gogos_016026, partial [Gossypium gossypioides]|nr:hypothetical protein [Gossypium gossypioides]